jgi:hypothetical protein
LTPYLSYGIGGIGSSLVAILALDVLQLALKPYISYKRKISNNLWEINVLILSNINNTNRREIKIKNVTKNDIKNVDTSMFNGNWSDPRYVRFVLRYVEQKNFLKGVIVENYGYSEVIFSNQIKNVDEIVIVVK